MKATVKRPLPNAPQPTKAVRVDDRQISESFVRKFSEMSEEQRQSANESNHRNHDRNPWSDEELREVKHLRMHGYTYNQIAQSLGRTKQSVKSAVQRMLDHGEVKKKVVVKK